MTETITLHYEDLTFEVLYLASEATYDCPEEWDSLQITKDWDYEVDTDDVLEFLYHRFLKNINLCEEELSDEHSNEIFNDILDNFDTYLDEYYQDVLDYFEEDAREDALNDYENDKDNFEYDD